MPILSVALYGSRARGDYDSTSDTDFLYVTSEHWPRQISENNISVSFYPENYLYQKAYNGDLFIYHLILEAKILFDESNIFEKIRLKFCLRDSYAIEVAQASELGWFLVRHGLNFENINIINRRIAWCVRTILIARTVEAHKPVFATKALAEFAKSNIVEELIQRKTAFNIDDSTFSDFTEFLNIWGSGDIQAKDKSSLEYLRYFKKTNNKVALQTCRNEETMPTDYYTS